MKNDIHIFDTINTTEFSVDQLEIASTKHKETKQKRNNSVSI